MDELTAYKNEISSLKNKMAQVEVKIQGCKEDAAALKKTLTEMGYKDLNEAKADYAKRTADLKGKREQIANIMKQITEVEKSLKTKDEILAELRNSVSNVATTDFVSVPEDIVQEQTIVGEVSEDSVVSSESPLLDVSEESGGDDMFGDLGI